MRSCLWDRMSELPAGPRARYWSDLARLLAPPAGAARLKTAVDDFQVAEELGFALSGAGEHLCVEVEKTGLTTTRAASRLAEATGLKRVDVGYAGMKDRRARTRQWFSLRLPAGEETRLQSVEDESLRILQSRRNHRKIRIGSHRANRFVIALRDFRGERDDIEHRLRTLARMGVPNYFGPQRFGRLFGNLELIERRIHAQAGEGAAKISRKERSLLYSAARAALFNQVLSARLARGDWSRYVTGDVLSLDGSGRLFLPPAEGWNEDLQQRLEALDIHVTGPLPGAASAQSKYEIRGQAADIEIAALHQNTGMLDWLKREGLRAGRRQLRFAPRDINWNWTDGGLTLRFTLARGCYATSLLREVCITDGSEQEAELES